MNDPDIFSTGECSISRKKLKYISGRVIIDILQVRCKLPWILALKSSITFFGTIDVKPII